MIKQIMINLLNNAVEVMPKGGEIKIITKSEVTEPSLHSMLVVSVIDSGPGIPDEIRDTLFDPFVRAKEQGIGLGLSISQRIADLHHGYIKASNNTQKGAAFSLYLPLDSTFNS